MSYIHHTSYIRQRGIKNMVKDVEKYFDNSKCKICGVVVQPHFQGNTKLPKEEHLAKEHQDLE